MVIFEQMQEQADTLYNDLMVFSETSSKYESDVKSIKKEKTTVEQFEEDED